MSENKSTPQLNRTIVAPFVQEKYSEIIENPQFFRKALETLTWISQIQKGFPILLTK